MHSDDIAPLMDAISTYVALALSLAHTAQREEFILVAMRILHTRPESLVVPAIHAICEDRIKPYEFVAEVIERTQKKEASLRREAEAIDRIIKLSQRDGK